MIIFAKGNSHFINFDKAENFYTSATGSVKVDMMSGRGNQLGVYQNHDCCKKALEMLVDRIHKGGETVYMPTDEEVELALKNENKEEPWHHATGKKVKRHGGS